jgi:hypothetical protein
MAARHKQLLSTGTLNYLIQTAAAHNDVAMMSLLVDLGADINASKSETDPEGCIDHAASAGAVDAVRWLLNHSAQINCTVNGVVRCFPLAGAVLGGHLEVVKLLVDRGADINATWNGQNALSFAIMYRKKEVEDYLRSIGARTPWEIRGEPMPGTEAAITGDPLLDHITEHLGTPEPLSLQEIVQGDPPISIHVVLMEGGKALVTTGMSSKPMTVPKGGEEYEYAELLIYLPEDWPLDESALRDPNYYWPIEWLRRIARYPHVNHTWLGGRSAVIANDEPPKPLAPNTKLTCLLAVTEVSEFGTLQLPDGHQVQFYSLYPLYTEERDLEKQKGTRHILKLFQQHGIGKVVDVKRRNVAI